MTTLIALAWPVVVLVGIALATFGVRALLLQRQSIVFGQDTLEKRLATVEAGASAFNSSLSDLSQILNVRLEKLERLNQGVPPKADRHSEEQLRRFR